MLVLTRKIDEKIIIGLKGRDGEKDTKIGEVVVCEFKTDLFTDPESVDRVRLGLDFHDDIVIHRQEVWDQIQGGSSGTGKADGQES